MHPYRYVAIKTVKVNIDYHVSYEQHHYSVPHQYVGQQLELHAGEFCFRSITSNSWSRAIHVNHPGMSTLPEHMPERHSKQQRWTPGRLKQWAADIGPSTLCWVSERLERKPMPSRHTDSAWGC